jgi:pyruvate/2-oxoglutarate dehydrogenase complex dihydrolipoamide dehydrogenase (E3) component
MPTLYSLLRARHRPATPPPERPTQRDIPSRPVMAAKKGPQVTRSIAIVGGGLAGLCAAYELSNFGCTVTVAAS